MKYFISLIFVFSFLLSGCSKDEDGVKPIENDSFITGGWETLLIISSGGDSDSLGVNLNLAGKDGLFSGDGEVKFCSKKNNTTFRCNFNDDVTGIYTKDEITVSLISSLSDDSYHFAGERVVSEDNIVSFKGDALLKVNEETLSFENVTLFKK